jgi:hypothetical protein
MIYDLIPKACFLMTHDPEFMATGVETKINYHMYYDFYLEHLFKRTPWAHSVLNYFNKVFDVTSSGLTPAPDSPFIATQTRTWEDDLLDELDAPTQVTSALTSIPATLAVVDVISNYCASISVNQGQSASATAQLQLGVSRLTLDNTIEPAVSAPRSVSSRQPQAHATASELTYAPEPTNTPEREVEAPKCVTCHGGSSKAVAKPRG